MSRPENRDRESRLILRARRLRIDAGTAEVLRGFGDEGVDFRLLKGPSIAEWLYTETDSRFYVDCDVLVAPRCRELAEEILSHLGYARVFDDRSMPSWWREHAGEWSRREDGMTIDLHRTLPGVGVDDHAAWRLLAADAAVVVVAGRRWPTLSLRARALHVALHAAQHGADWGQPLADLQRAVATGDDDLWREASQLAEELEATDALVSGLRLTPEGAQLSSRLRLPGTRSAEAELLAGSPPSLALGFAQLARAQGWRSRLEIVLRKLVPPPAFVRHWDPRAASGRPALLRAYLRRPLWLLRHAPRGLGAWRRAQRAARAPSRRNDEPRQRALKAEHTEKLHQG